MDARPLVARGVGIPPRLCRFFAREGVLGTTLDAARTPAIEVRGVLAASEHVVDTALRTGLSWVCWCTFGASSARALDVGARLLRAVRRLTGRDVLIAEVGLLTDATEGGRTLRREEAREGVAEGGREMMLARLREGVMAPERSGASEARDDGLLDMDEAGRATASVGGAWLIATTLEAGQKTPFAGAHAKYWVPWTLPSFFPLPTLSPVSSRPA